MCIYTIDLGIDYYWQNINWNSVHWYVQGYFIIIPGAEKNKFFWIKVWSEYTSVNSLAQLAELSTNTYRPHSHYNNQTLWVASLTMLIRKSMATGSPARSLVAEDKSKVIHHRSLSLTRAVLRSITMRFDLHPPVEISIVTSTSSPSIIIHWVIRGEGWGGMLGEREYKPKQTGTSGCQLRSHRLLYIRRITCYWRCHFD